MSTAFTSLKDHFLIALPSLEDMNFSRTVTYICEHTPQGAMGLVLNRPTQMQLTDILNHMSIEQSTLANCTQVIYAGGPVEEQRGFVLHSATPAWDSTLKISEQIFVTTSKDILQAMAMGQGPDKFLLALGYAGWGPGQLEAELKQDSWLSCPADSAIIFDLPSEERWLASARLMGIDLNLINSIGGHA